MLELVSQENIISADLYHHHICYTDYIHKCKSSLCAKYTTEQYDEHTNKSTSARSIPIVESIPEVRNGC